MLRVNKRLVNCCWQKKEGGPVNLGRPWSVLNTWSHVTNTWPVVVDAWGIHAQHRERLLPPETQSTTRLTPVDTLSVLHSTKSTTPGPFWLINYINIRLSWTWIELISVYLRLVRWGSSEVKFGLWKSAFLGCTRGVMVSVVLRYSYPHLVCITIKVLIHYTPIYFNTSLQNFLVAYEGTSFF